jgi:hypothetical protein
MHASTHELNKAWRQVGAAWGLVVAAMPLYGMGLSKVLKDDKKASKAKTRQTSAATDTARKAAVGGKKNAGYDCLPQGVQHAADTDKRVNTVIPASGLGSRFAERGYVFPKPHVCTAGQGQQNWCSL